MSDITNPHDMQIVAFSSTQQLLYDASNSQLFYLYTPSTKALTPITSPVARAFYNAAPNQSYGFTGWGNTQVEGSHIGKNSIN